MKLIFDIEADNLLDDVTQVWCIVTRDADTKEVNTFDLNNIQDGLKFLSKADTLIGHNIIEYDLRVLKKLYNYEYKGSVEDTLVYARTIWADIREIDIRLNSRGNFSQKLIGSHSLKAWGYRLGELKGDFAVQGVESFANYTPEMLDYCIQDTQVNDVLYSKILSKKFSQDALDLETKLHTLLIEQQEVGFNFDVVKAQKLFTTLSTRRADIEEELINTFEPTIVELKTKTKTIPFNPASRMQIADRLMKRGWKPEFFTDRGEPKVDETTLATIDMPEAEMLREYLLLNKRLGQLGTGKFAWLKMEKEGKLHGRTNHMGAVTSRCTHSNPNIAQVPSLNAKYGKECRELFYAPEGYSLLGADASGLELRCLAHYIALFDKGVYADTVVNGDIHTINQEAAGLPTRDNAKTFIYGFLYGAGDAKTGSIIGKGAKEGKAIKSKFLAKLPALAKLRDAVAKSADKNGFVKGLDGRLVPVRHAHASLNTLLQSAGALVCKTWYVYIADEIKKAGLDATIVDLFLSQKNIYDDLLFLGPFLGPFKCAGGSYLDFSSI